MTPSDMTQSRNCKCPPISGKAKRALFRALRPQARLLSLVRRDDLLHSVHGKVHGRLELCQQVLRRKDTKGDWCWRYLVKCIDPWTTCASSNEDGEVLYDKSMEALEYHILMFAMCGAAFLTKIYGVRILRSGIDLEHLTGERDGIVL